MSQKEEKGWVEKVALFTVKVFADKIEADLDMLRLGIPLKPGGPPVMEELLRRGWRRAPDADAFVREAP